jgi:nicotinamidase-related amidase
MSLSSTDRGPLTPDNSALNFIDHQSQMLFGVANIDRQALLNNMQMLAKAAKIFRVPVILTAVESEEGEASMNTRLSMDMTYTCSRRPGSVRRNNGRIEFPIVGTRAVVSALGSVNWLTKEGCTHG